MAERFPRGATADAQPRGRSADQIAVDPTVLIEGVGGSAAAVGVVRRRLRSPRVRREPIDVQLAAAEIAETGPALDADEILLALEAEVGRVATSRTATATPSAPAPTARRGDAPSSGISSDQVRAWMDQVQDDLRKVRARVEYLHLEQSRLEEQQHLMAQLITSSTPI